MTEREGAIRFICVAVLGCALVIMTVAAGMFFSGHEAIFMNGEVAQAHVIIESRCDSCHQPWAGAVADKCITCHLPVLLGTNHAMTDQACAMCHREHGGRTKDLRQVEVRQCLACHQDVLTEARHPLDTAQQCLFCHGEHTPATFVRTVERDLILSHKAHTQDPGLVKAPCVLCHQPSPNPGRMQFPPEPVCRACHFGYTRDKTKDIRGKDCVLCHNPDQRRVPAQGKGFATLRFSHGAHQAFSCEECHREIDLRTTLAEMTLPDVQMCKRCH